MDGYISFLPDMARTKDVGRQCFEHVPADTVAHGHARTAGGEPECFRAWNI